MNATTKKNVNTLIGQADELYSAREQYETATLARSNQELYDILSQVLALYQKAVKKNCLKDTTAAMKDCLGERGVKVQINTKAMTVFVRYVFNSDRKRSYTYTQTLLAALDNKVTPERLAGFIEDNSGVEEIKRSAPKSEKALENARAREDAMNQVVAQLQIASPLATVNFGNNSVAQSDGTTYAFVIARAKADGELELISVVPETTVALEKAAMKILAKNHLDKKVDADLEDVEKRTWSATEKAGETVQVNAEAA